MKIGIVVGSIRQGAVGPWVGEWVSQLATQRDDAEFELISLADFDVPLCDTPVPPMMLNKEYGDERVTRWSQALEACDAYVFVTAEYNHGVPGAFKNAIDWMGPELTGKAVGFVGYGAEGASRAVEQWRQILANFSMYSVRAQVGLGIFTERDENGIVPNERRAGELTVMLDQLVAAAAKLAA